MQEALMALNGVATTILIIAISKYAEGLKKELKNIKAVVEKNKENEEAFKKDVKETISKEFLAMAFRGIRYWK